MAPQPKPPVSPAEREVLRVLWDHGPATVRQMQERLEGTGPDWQRSTVITLLQRLEKKEYVASDRSRHAFVFRAVVSRDELLHQRMVELADELCDGQPAPLLLAFAERQTFTPDELRELRQLIDDLSQKQAPPPRKR
jgi:BlaI family penicillinase repressor